MVGAELGKVESAKKKRGPSTPSLSQSSSQSDITHLDSTPGTLSIKAEDTTSMEVWGQGIEHASERDWEGFLGEVRLGLGCGQVGRGMRLWGGEDINTQGVLWVRAQGRGIESAPRHSVCYNVTWSAQ